VEHVRMGTQGVPGILRNSITALATMNSSKIEWPMNKGVSVGEIEVFTIGK